MAHQLLSTYAPRGTVRQCSVFSTTNIALPSDPTIGITAATPVTVQRISGLLSSGRSDPAGQTSAVQPLAPTEHEARIALARRDAHAAHERHLRHIGADLHDGPAQLLALALLHLSAVVPAKPTAEVAAAASAMRDAITGALHEIRDISVGLILPELDRRDAADTVRLAVDTFERRTGCKVAVEDGGLPPGFNPAKDLKICLYRFVQEGLQNGFKHAKGAAQSVTIRCVRTAGGRDASLVAEVRDFRPDTCGDGCNTISKLVLQRIRPELRDSTDGPATGLGLAGMKERIDALNGTLDVKTTVTGTMLTAQFAIATDE
jgi:signal transduction histidine kinase